MTRWSDDPIDDSLLAAFRSPDHPVFPQCYNRPVLKFSLCTTFLLIVLVCAQSPQQTPTQPPVRLNILNVCTPSAEEQAVIKSTMDRVPGKPAFITDFEMTRGRITMKDAAASKFVRLRREFPPDSPLLTVQYSISTDADSTVELLVFNERETKDFHEIAIEDRVSAGAASPVAVVSMNTPVNRIKVERFGKSSVGLSRCEGADQSAYEPLFRQASEIMARYRAALGLRTSFRSDVAWLNGSQAKAPRAGSAQQNSPK